MKRIVKYLMMKFFSIIVMCGFSASVYSQVSFNNGDFEAGNTAGWNVFNPHGNSVNWAVTSDSEDVHGGTYAGRLSQNSGADEMVIIFQSVDVSSFAAGTLLRVAWYIKTDNLVFTTPSNSAGTVLRCSNSSWEPLVYSYASGLHAGTTEYTLVEHLVELPAGTAVLECMMNIPEIASGSLCFDDLTVEVFDATMSYDPSVFPDCEVYQDISGSPRLSINGYDEPPTMFFGNTGGHVIYDEIEKAGAADVNLIQLGVELPWNGFSTGQMALALERNPNAMFLLRVNMSPPASWLAANPLPKIVADDGTLMSICTLASDDLAEEWNHQLNIMVRFLAQGPFSDRIISIHPTYLEAGEWFYPEINLHYYDYSEVNRARFADWAAQRYNQNLGELNAAWLKSLSAFSEIQIPPRSEWLSGDQGWFRDPAQRRWMTDYQLYHNDLVADRIISMATQLKNLTAGRMLYTCFGGYQMELLLNSFRQGVGNSGHMSLRRVLESPDVDIIASPTSYMDRGDGGPSNLMGPVDSIALAGKLQLQEEDSRTWLWTPWPEPGNDGVFYPTEWDTLQCLRRNFGNVLTHNLATWWMDLNANGAFNANSIWTNNSTLISMYVDSIQRKLPAAPQVAWIYDEDTPFWLKGDSIDLTIPNGYTQRSIFQSLGAQVGYYHIQDLDKLPNTVRLIVFINTFRMDDNERLLVEAVKSHGRTLLWLYAPGYVTETSLSIPAMSTLTGIPLELASSSMSTEMSVVDIFAPLTSGLSGHSFGAGTGAMQPVFKAVAGTPGVRALGTYTQGGGVGLALKESTAWNSIFCGAPVLSQKTLRAIARYSGVNLQVDGDKIDNQTDALQTNGRYMYVYARGQAGRRSFRLPCERVPNGGFDRETGALPTSGFGQWISPDSGSLTASVVDGAGYGGSNGLKVGPFAQQANQFSVPFSISLPAEEGRTYDYSCRVRLSGLDASQVSGGNYIFLQMTAAGLSANSVTIPLAQGQNVVQQNQWLYFSGRYTHQSTSVDQPQMKISLWMYGAYAGTEIVIDDVSVCEVELVPNGGVELYTGALPTSGFGQWISPDSGSLTASVVDGAGYGGSNGLKVGPFAQQANQFSVPFSISLPAEEGRTYDYSCRVRLSGLDASQVSGGNYIFLQMTAAGLSANSVTIPLAQGQNVVQQNQWLYFSGRYTHQSTSVDQPQMKISLWMYGAYAGTEIVIDDVSIRKVGVRANVQDAVTGLPVATDTTHWVDDFQENEQKVYRIDSDYMY